jgi:ADP-heptose:LPS heptosyltransferase
MRKFKKIIISRTDNLGDVILTLPLAGIIKSVYKDCELYFIGKSYTYPLISSCNNIDFFIDRENILKDPATLSNINADAILFIYPDKELAKAAFKAKVPLRIGTSHRLFHWMYCNKLVWFSRRKSPMHEIELNQKLLEPIGITVQSKEALEDQYGMSRIEPLNPLFSALIQKQKFNLILHPKSKGSAREWPLNHYLQLIQLLPEKDFEIFITGTQAEGDLIKSQLPELYNFRNVHDLSGKCSLAQLIAFINTADGLVACSTGPLHISSALGKFTCGIYPPMKPIHPGRWAPIGKKSKHLVLEKVCIECKNSNKCYCIEAITVNQVKEVINLWRKNKA